MAQAPVPPGADVGLPRVVHHAGAHRRGVLLQRRPVAERMAGLLVPVVGGRSDGGRVAPVPPGPANRDVPDRAPRRPHDAARRPARHAVRDRHRPVARTGSGAGQLHDAAVLRRPRDHRRRLAVPGLHLPAQVRDPGDDRADPRPSHLSDVVPGDRGASQVALDREGVRGGRHGPRRRPDAIRAPCALAAPVSGHLRQRGAGVRRLDRRLHHGPLSSEPLSVKIYDSARAAPPPSVNAAATFMLVVTLVAITIGFIVYRRVTRGERVEAAREFVGFQV